LIGLNTLSLLYLPCLSILLIPFLYRKLRKKETEKDSTCEEPGIDVISETIKKLSAISGQTLDIDDLGFYFRHSAYPQSGQQKGPEIKNDYRYQHQLQVFKWQKFDQSGKKA
jgi:hypothetical protein